MNKEIKEEYKAIGETDDEIIYEVKWTEENGYYTDKIKIPKSFIQFQKQDLIKKIKERADKLYCTSDHLGYHDKNCEGLPCEKAVLLDIINLLKR